MSFTCTKKYYDDQNFPRGFHRSGDFTRAQADILESKGVVLKALHEGRQAPATEEESQFLSMCQEQQEAQTPIEKAWKSYLSALSRKQVYFTASSVATTETDTDPIDNGDDE